MRSECSAATLLRRLGILRWAISADITRTRLLFNLIGTTYGGRRLSRRLRCRIYRAAFPFVPAPPNPARPISLEKWQGSRRYPDRPNGSLRTTIRKDAKSVMATARGRQVSAGEQHVQPWRMGTHTTRWKLERKCRGITGGSQPHDNIQPYLCVNFIISLFGIFRLQIRLLGSNY